MARCADCAWFPWKPGADLSMLPTMRCHRELAARRWSRAGAEAKTGCPFYTSPKSEAPDQAIEAAAVEQPASEPKTLETRAKAKSATKPQPKAEVKPRSRVKKRGRPE